MFLDLKELLAKKSDNFKNSKKESHYETGTPIYRKKTASKI